MAKIRRLLLIVAFTGLMTGAPALMAPAQACTGEVCDAICYIYWDLGKPCPIR